MNREERGLYNFEEYKNLKYPINKKPIILVFLILILANFFNILLQNKDEIKIHIENTFNIVNENIFNNNMSEDVIQDEDIINNDDYNNKLLLSQEDIQNISSSMSQYFENIIKSINTGDFSYLENILVKNSNLYISQQKLVERLYNLGTTEKLESFEIIEIDDSNILNGIIKVEVLELISIYYASGESKTSEFNYIYTLENIQNTWLLSDIE